MTRLQQQNIKLLGKNYKEFFYKDETVQSPETNYTPLFVTVFFFILH